MSRKRRRAREPGSLLPRTAEGEVATVTSGVDSRQSGALPLVVRGASGELEVEGSSEACGDERSAMGAGDVAGPGMSATDASTAATVAEASLPNEGVVDLGPVGARLRAAREALGWSREELAARARIPISAIANIEANNLDALGAVIYARGFLRSYARAVGVADGVVESALQSIKVEEPALVAVNPTSLGSRLVARYTNPVVYGLLTLAVVVPLVFLAAPKGPRQSPQAFNSMDAAQTSSVATTGTAPPTTSSTPDGTPPLPAGDVSEMQAIEPVMASIAPMPTTTAAAQVRPEGARVLTLKVSEPTWVELTAADGRRLEYAQLPPGTTRDYVVDGGADLVIGNAPAVVATLNGEAVDLNAVANRNVARLRVGDDAATARQ